MKASHLRRAMRLWPPYLFAGIRVKHISPDFRAVDVELRHGRFNMNYVGTHFGGSIFSMTDPFYVLMLSGILGRDYVIWDRAAAINFIRPGTGTLLAKFRLTDEMLDAVRANTAKPGDRYLPVWPVDVRDSEGEIVASVDKTLYIRNASDQAAAGRKR